MSQVSEQPPATTRHLTFCGLSIAYDHRVLEPRPWTQAQSQWGAELLGQAPAGPVLELCAGVGHIGLGAIRDADRSLVMVDVNPVARDFALANAAGNGLGERVEVRLARIDEALEPGERFPLVIADPPWVRSAETSRFPEDPVLAIDGGDDGLDLARTCVDLIDAHLAVGGSALLQLGPDGQAEVIAAYADQRSGGALTVAQTRTFERGVLVQLTR